MKLTAEEVKKIARLARLKLTDKEIEQYQSQLSEVLTYIKQLDEVKGTAGATRMTAATNVMSDDEVTNQPRTKELLAGAPLTEGDSIKVKAVFDE
ncbi:Asp-tRNA(Asn)/Glu-tRNA(Gln) amidotransferase subunit GatC [Patescibacteria group bacterium]|nr:Asp-tRNA(Asn)/Glu-tRNA(Gln) amidotransferase subunit GatC [Patescibacteria group bacterium]